MRTKRSRGFLTPALFPIAESEEGAEWTAQGDARHLSADIDSESIHDKGECSVEPQDIDSERSHDEGQCSTEAQFKSTQRFSRMCHCNYSYM